MQKRYKKRTACVLALLLGLTCAVSPVFAAEGTGTNTETGELQEIDETAVPISDTEGTNVEGGTDTENGEEKEITDIEEVTENQNTKTENPVSLFSTASTVVPLATEDTSPIEISNADDLIDFATKINDGTYSTDTNAILTDNIDMSGKPYTPIGIDTSHKYSGTFDGQGNTVTLNISSTSNNVGLFGYIDGATIQNVGVTGTISTTLSYTGGIVANVYGNSTIKGCWNKAEIKANIYVGGIAGYIDSDSNVKIENCYNTGAVTANSTYAGGIAGINRSSVTNCYNTGAVTASSYGGGIAGRNDGSVTNCYNTGAVTANSCVGGIAGRNNGSITNCYNTGTVTANNSDVGGIAGNNSGTVTNCYNTGAVTAGSYVGGIAGYNYPTGTITNCYYLEDSSSSAGGGTLKTETEFNSGEVTWLLNGSTSEGVWKQTLEIGENYTTADDYPVFDGRTVYRWNNGEYHNEEQTKSPTPTFNTSQTASSITVTLTNYTADYGDTQYSLNGTDWQDSNEFDNLKANQSYTVYVKYAGAGKYLESDTAQESVTTNSASYTITIPSTTLTAGGTDSNTISADTTNPFELGTGGKVIVKVKEDENISLDGKLTLTREGTANTVTSALLVNGSAFTDITKPVITFTMEDYSLAGTGAEISFAAPTETEIPAGDYKGTVSFVISYMEE